MHEDIWTSIHQIKRHLERIDARQTIILWALGGVIMTVIGAAITIIANGG